MLWPKLEAYPAATRTLHNPMFSNPETRQPPLRRSARQRRAAREWSASGPVNAMDVFGDVLGFPLVWCPQFGLGPWVVETLSVCKK